MPAETVLSSYILRLTRKRNRLHVGLQNVRTGETQHFDGIEALIAHLEGLGVGQGWHAALEGHSRAPPDDAEPGSSAPETEP